MKVEAPRVVVIGLGSNVGDRRAHLQAAVDALHRAAGVIVEAVSLVYETEPLGPPQPRYLNAAARVRTSLSPDALLALTQSIEAERGRQRAERWGPRTLDIDLLWTSGEPVSTASVEMPHPGLIERSFALSPLLDVLPDAPALYRERLEALGGALKPSDEVLSSPK